MKNQFLLVAVVLMTGCPAHENEMVNPQTALAAPLNAALCAVKNKRIAVSGGNGTGIYLDGYPFAYNPGDTLVLNYSSVPWNYFSLEGFHSTAALPVVIINSGSQVNKVRDFLHIAVKSPDFAELVFSSFHNNFILLPQIFARQTKFKIIRYLLKED